jgi:hypothetical protein
MSTASWQGTAPYASTTTKPPEHMHVVRESEIRPADVEETVAA